MRPITFDSRTIRITGTLSESRLSELIRQLNDLISAGTLQVMPNVRWDWDAVNQAWWIRLEIDPADWEQMQRVVAVEGTLAVSPTGEQPLNAIRAVGDAVNAFAKSSPPRRFIVWIAPDSTMDVHLLEIDDSASDNDEASFFPVAFKPPHSLRIPGNLLISVIPSVQLDRLMRISADALDLDHDRLFWRALATGNYAVIVGDPLAFQKILGAPNASGAP